MIGYWRGKRQDPAHVQKRANAIRKTCAAKKEGLRIPSVLRCRMGGHLRPISAFAADRRRLYGVRSSCRACSNKKHSARRRHLYFWNDDLQEKLKKEARAYYARNAERIRARNRAYKAARGAA